MICKTQSTVEKGQINLINKYLQHKHAKKCTQTLQNTNKHHIFFYNSKLKQHTNRTIVIYRIVL